ncbi:MAG: hypothetical protein IT365_10225 [Candidatus Hydrogenedentes bacterium]|nr:hypothetical protein [Candidatus Hydrogenedentota bacterium]
MSDQFLEEFCQKLEATIAESESQSGQAEQNLNTHFVQIMRLVEGLANEMKTQRRAGAVLRQTLTDELGALRQALTGTASVAEAKQQRLEQLEHELAGQLEALQAGRRRVDELVHLVERRDEELRVVSNRVQAVESDLSAARSEMESLRQEARSAGDAEAAISQELDAARAELEEARETIESLQSSAEKVGAAERLLESERARANELETRLRMETANGTKAVLAQQLADALREVETLRSECLKLTSETEGLRKAAQERAEQERLASAERQAPPRKLKGERDGLPKRQMDEILLEAGVITQNQLEEALAQQSEDPQRSLAEILVEQGAATEEVVAQAVAAQHRVLFVRLDRDSVDPAAASLISARIASHHRCVPLRATEESLVLAMVDPLNLIAIEDVERASHRSVRPVMATQSDISATIDRLYQEASEQAM